MCSKLNSRSLREDRHLLNHSATVSSKFLKGWSSCDDLCLVEETADSFNYFFWRSTYFLVAPRSTVFISLSIFSFWPLFFFNRPRFGLFSQPVSTAIGDTNAYKKVSPRKDENGAVISGPRNFTTKKGKKGGADDVYFSRSGYLCVGDPFKQVAIESMRSHVKNGW